MRSKITLLLMMLILMSMGCHAQYNGQNSSARRALVVYVCGADGYYHSNKDVVLDELRGAMTPYAFDKQTNNLYVVTPSSNCEVTLTKESAKIIRRDKDIPQLKNAELEAAIAEQDRILEQKFDMLNQLRTRHLQDSVAKVRADSIEQVRRDSIERVRRTMARETYRKTHHWQCVPIERATLQCVICDEVVSDKDTINCLGVNNDSILYYNEKDGALNWSFVDWHVAKLPASLKEEEAFRYHCEVFRDSLIGVRASSNVAKTLLASSYAHYADNLRMDAPHGYIGDWGWNHDNSYLSFHFDYTNTNEISIKYITVYFRVTNDAGVVRKIGHFQGAGPVGEFETCSWDWDTSPYQVADDATQMELTKVSIVYMDGTGKVLPKDQIVFN